jgi:hypothetical protein
MTNDTSVRRKILTPSELLDLWIAGTPPPDHDLVRWRDSNGEHTATVLAYRTILSHDVKEARAHAEACERIG